MRYIGIVWLLVAGVVHAADAKYFRPHHPPNHSASQSHSRRALNGAVVVNAASFEEGVSPGGLATAFGQNLTSVNGIVVAGTNPLPLSLAGVRVLVNGLPAPIFSVAYANGEDQISFQVPYAISVGPGAAEITILDGNFQTADVITDSFSEDPGIFTYQGDLAVAEASDGSLIGPGNPAFAGEAIAVYTTGLGPVTVAVPDGYGAPSNPLAWTADPVDVRVAGESARILFSGLTPGFAGLYQVNFVVPPDAPPGNLDLQIVTPYADSTVVTLPVR